MSGRQEKTALELHAPATRSRYDVQVDQMKETRKLAEDGDEVAKRFMRLSGEEQRAQMVGTDELGGYTVPDSDMGLLETALLRYNSIMQAGPRMFNTSDGRPIPVVKNDDTANEGEWLAERQTSSEGEVNFERGELRAHSVGSYRIPISFELLRDSGFDILSYIIDLAYIRVGRAMGRAMTVGDGVGKPRGAAVDAHEAVAVGAGASVVLTYNNILDFFSELPAAYASMMPVLQLSRKTRFGIMKIVDTQGRPLFLPSLVPDAPGTVLGDRYVENDFLDEVGGASRTVMLYGDWMRYFARNVQMVEVSALLGHVPESAQHCG